MRLGSGDFDVAPLAISPQLLTAAHHWSRAVRALASRGPGDLRLPETSTISVRSIPSGAGARRTRKSGAYSCERPSCTYGIVNPSRSFLTYAATRSSTSSSFASPSSQEFPRTPSSTTWFRCDFTGPGSMTTLRVRKRTSSVEPSFRAVPRPASASRVGSRAGGRSSRRPSRRRVPSPVRAAGTPS